MTRLPALLFALLFPSLALAAPTSPFEGAWEGALDVGAIKLRLVLKLHQSGARWEATLDSIDQGASGIPVDEVIIDGDHITLAMPKLSAGYEARRDGQKLVGTWKQGGGLPLTLTHTEHPVAIARKPQEPIPPLPYDAIDLTIDNKVGKATLACTLTHPRDVAKAPAVILITGSGPQDRDEQLLGHKPFLVIADSLTRRGIAVLRCDDRGVAKSTGDLAHATTMDFVGDVVAELAALRARPDIDPARVGLCGHSEGGLIAPIVASQSKDVAFIVLLAGPGVVGEQILYAQGEAIERAAGTSEAEIKSSHELRARMFAVLKTEKDDAVIEKKLRALLEALPEADRKKAGLTREAMGVPIRQMMAPWFRAFLVLDPAPYLKKVTVPVLALNGEHDLQVPPKQNLPALTAALAGNKDVTTRELPGLNHLFQTCKTGSPAEYATIEETFAPSALTLLGDWIVAHVKAPSGK